MWHNSDSDLTFRLGPRGAAKRTGAEPIITSIYEYTP